MAKEPVTATVETTSPAAEPVTVTVVETKPAAEPKLSAQTLAEMEAGRAALAARAGNK
jgi:hypothetical protein